MYRMLKEGDYRISVGDQKVDFADTPAKELFHESIGFFNTAGLANRSLLQVGNTTYIFTWLGDKIVNTIVALLIRKDYEAGAYAGVIEIEKSSLEGVKATLQTLAQAQLPNETMLAESVLEKQIEKFDEFLPDDVLSIGYGTKTFDTNGAKKWLDKFSLEVGKRYMGS